MSTTASKPARPTARKRATVATKRAAPAPARKKVASPTIKPTVPPKLSTPAPSAAAAAPVNAARAEASKAPKASKGEKHRVKLVRDSFAMPEADFALIDILKARAVIARRPAKKSELLRAGLKALAAFTPVQLAAALQALTPVKTGRPKRGH